VVDATRRPVGVLSIDDLARMVDKAKRSGAEREFVHMLAEICRPTARPAKKTGAVVV
jgi:hypothetical protein